MYFIPALVDLALGAYVFFKFSHSKTNKAFVVFVFTLGLAQFFDAFMRISSEFPTAVFWNKISSAPWAYILTFELLFVFRYTNWYKKTNFNVVLIALLVLSTVLEMFLIGGLITPTIIPSSTWGWTVIPGKNIETTLLYTWNSLLSITCLAMYWIYYYTVRNISEKKTAALLLATGNTISFFIGFIGDVFVPYFCNHSALPVSGLSIVVFSVCIFIAIKHYNALEFLPKHQFDSILEVMNEGLVIVNTKGEIMYANHSFCKELGYELSELKGKTGEGLLVTEPSQINKLRQGIKDRAKNNKGQYEILGTTKTGKKLWFMLNSTPYLDTKGNVIGSVVILTNINKLKEANKDFELFCYKISHDLRGPLASILGLTNLYKHEKSESEKPTYVDMIEIATHKADELLTTLSANIQIRNSDDFNDNVSLVNILYHTIEKLKKPEESNQINISVHNHIKNTFLSNEKIWSLIFYSLIDNAIKYKDVSKDICTLTIQLTETHQNRTICFEDNGTGIDPKAVSNVFDMFYRGSEKSKGVGLGLYMVKTAVEKLNGKINIETELRKGTTINLIIPK